MDSAFLRPVYSPVQQFGVVVRAKADVYSPTKARDFEGAGGPETKQRLYEEANPGNDDVRGNVRQGRQTVRP